MKEIKWKNCDSRFVFADMGWISLRCYQYDNGKWRANIVAGQITLCITRGGPHRNSLSAAKDDAIRLAQELLLDYYAAVVELMPQFDVVQPEKEE